MVSLRDAEALFANYVILKANIRKEFGVYIGYDLTFGNERTVISPDRAKEILDELTRLGYLKERTVREFPSPRYFSTGKAPPLLKTFYKLKL